MTDEIVRMHLVQALTRTIDPDARSHVRAVLEALDGDIAASELSGNVRLDRIERAEAELETWLARHATGGTPELVLTGILRDYAVLVDDLGHVPRSWTSTAGNRHRYPSGPERSSIRTPASHPGGRDAER